MPATPAITHRLRAIAASLALLLALGALSWLGHRLEHLPPVQTGPWQDSEAPLVVVDAGHGGQDGGAVANGLVEKDLSLVLARQVRDHLEKSGLRVRMTREKDRFLELEERCQIAATTQADAFVSIHLNTSSSAAVHGLETYYADTRRGLLGRPAQAAEKASSKPPGEIMAEIVQRHAVQISGQEDRGIRSSQLIVVMRTPCPAVLVECGYITHTAEAARLSQKDHQAKLTQGIAEGVVKFLLGTPRSTAQVPAEQNKS